MKIDFIADTNFFIYVLEGNRNIEHFLDFNFGISFVSEIELLGYSGITIKDELQIRSLIKDCFYFDFNSDIKEETISLRRRYNIKLPDAIIASSSIINHIPLITADRGFEVIKELDLILLDI